MIVPCGPGQTMDCFEPGYEVPADVPVTAAWLERQAPTVPVPLPNFSLWDNRGDAVGTGSTAIVPGPYASSPYAPGVYGQGQGQTQAGHDDRAVSCIRRVGHGRGTVNMQTGSSRLQSTFTAPPNPFTQCLYREQSLWSRIAMEGGLHKLCCPSTPTDQPPPWVAMPSAGRHFQEIGSIILPLAEGVDNLVTTVAVPTGYDGVIVSVMNMYTGGGFVEGSGDLHFRIQINRRWLKDYGDIRTTLGSVAAPYAIYRSGIRLRTHEVVRYWVNLGAGALGRLDPTGRIVCGFFGWFYPQV